MSLNAQQMRDTRYELKKNFELTGLSKEQVASDLGISVVKLNRIFELEQNSLNDPFILRDYLLEKVTENDKTPVTFTAMGGDIHKYWFLDYGIVEQRRMTSGDY
ncbi:DUF2316 family protein [Companilactobacillus kimchiensis]|uniref:DUF2316 domain-containing protein n=1 Tax=Companilactobacillus kimchiensis TaxID=993692 RepID=A0A0R2LFX8_9LACO|nr:DUF2316 family protein [Companilactobacillus kimchiensis]KRO00772.1 hypothetical protein IV57_GL000092 [Companilactobacillus kimchiensis]